MTFLRHLLSNSVETLVRVACVLALVALTFFCVSVVFPGPLPVIFAMSVGHGIGFLACGCYVLALVLDAAKREQASPADEPPASVEHPSDS
jgi:hypothetical protein